jgi:hypothetical protein
MSVRSEKKGSRYIILSQKTDVESAYSDELYHVYHFPAKYRNQIHEGDIFLYYQGDRYHKGRRYYFGTGRVGCISDTDSENWYAELLDGKSFEYHVPIYFNGNSYVEQIGYIGTRRMPSFQTSIRSIAKEAYDYVISKAGKLEDVIVDEKDNDQAENSLDEKLMDAVNGYFLSNDPDALDEIIDTVQKLRSLTGRPEGIQRGNSVRNLLDYCRTMRMSFSYKPVLIMALLEEGKSGCVHTEDVTKYFRTYYFSRRKKGEKVEKKNCVFRHINVSDGEIERCIINNPIKALCSSAYFNYDAGKHVFSIRSDIWKEMSSADRTELFEICEQRIKNYFLSK